MNTVHVEKIIEELLILIGEDAGREGLKETPRRVAKSYEKLFEGYLKDPKKLITVFNNEGYNEMIIAKNIDFYSLCEHHLLPFYGKAHVGYSRRQDNRSLQIAANRGALFPPSAKPRTTNKTGRGHS